MAEASQYDDDTEVPVYHVGGICDDDTVEVQVGSDLDETVTSEEHQQSSDSSDSCSEDEEEEKVGSTSEAAKEQSWVTREVEECDGCLSKIDVALLGRNALMPMRQTAGSVGYDLAATEKVIIRPKEAALIRTGVTLKFKGSKFYATIHSRSGLARFKRVEVVGAPCIIDSDFNDKPIAIYIKNEGIRAFTVYPGMRVAQLVLHKRAAVVLRDPRIRRQQVLEQATKNSNTTNFPPRTGGFGSTGLV